MAFVATYYWQNQDEDEYHCGIFGHSFIRRLCVRWKQHPEEADVLPFSGEAFGTGGLRINDMPHLLKRQVLGRFDCLFFQIGENDIHNLNNHELLHAMLRIRDECHTQGVQHVCFETLFPRHDRLYNKRQRRFNAMMPAIHPDLVWKHPDELVSRDSICTKDGVHLQSAKEKDFAESIANALSSFV